MDDYLALFEDDSVPPDTKRARAFLPSFFVTAALPLKRIKSSVFERSYNGITLRLQGGLDGVPYGKYGRLILALLTTHAVLNTVTNKDGTVTIKYKSMKAFLDDLQLPKQRSGNIKEQLELFSTCQFLYKKETISKTVQRDLFSDYIDTKDMPKEVRCKIIDTGNISLVERYKRAELETTDGKYIGSVGMELTLPQKFVDLVKEHAVPIDYTTYKEISSPLGKDLYVFFTYRNNYISEGKPLFISRKSIVDQFLPQSSPALERVNYAYILEQISEIKNKYYKSLNVEILEGGGIMLYKSEVVIAEKDIRYIPLIGSPN